QAVNVEGETRNPSSFLHWLRRMLAVRREHPVLGIGALEVLSTENPSVLAYLRRSTGDDGNEDIVLCVNNLSRFAQPVELMIPQLAEKIPVEALGRVPFPAIGELPYFVTLHPYGFYWFTLHEPGLDQ
ncbi:MAG: maltose alpha-D-glucosyltransferase / alpha-amylase, partial [Acidimicrobiaceae bacterium]